MVGVRKVPDRGVAYGGVARPGVGQELLKLVAADVAEDAAELLPLEEPIRAGGFAQPVGSEADNLDDAAYGALLHEVGCKHRRLVVQPLAVIDHVLAPRPRDNGLGLVELGHRRERRLVAEVVLASLHDLAAEGSPFRGHGRRGDQADPGVGQNLVNGARGLRLGELGPEGLGLLGIRVIDPFERRTRLQQAVAHAVDVPVVEAGGRKDKLTGLDDRVGLSLGGVVHAFRFLGRAVG
jgi:hypothetical protein